MDLGQPYTGRAKGLVLKEASLDRLLRTTLQPTLTPVALAWKNVRYAAINLLNKRKLYEKGALPLTKLHAVAIQMTAVYVQPIAKDLGRDVNVGMMIHALLTDDTEDLIDVLQDLNDRAKDTANDSAQQRMNRWAL